MLAFSNDYYGMIFRATQSVELFCAYDYTIQLIENVLLFLPAGILCPWMWKQIRNWKRSFLLGFAGSLLIETLQMLTGRGLFQLDDLITNAAGMMAGYGIYQIAKKLWKRVYKSRFQ